MAEDAGIRGGNRLELQLRPLTQADFEPLRLACYPHYRPQRLLDQLTRSLNRQEQRVALHLVALTHNQLVGTAQLLHHNGRGEIAEVVVTAAYRNHGIGSAMIRHLLNEAHTRAWRPVEIIVGRTNSRARALYERLGFAYQQTIFTPTGEEADLLIMNR